MIDCNHPRDVAMVINFRENRRYPNFSHCQSTMDWKIATLIEIHAVTAITSVTELRRFAY